MTTCRRGLVLALGALAGCIYQGKSRPVDGPLTKAVRFVELDERGRAFDLSGTGLPPEQLLDRSSEARRVPDPALVDINSTVHVRIDRDHLATPGGAALSETRSKELLATKQRIQTSLGQIRRALDLRTEATKAWGELMRSRRENRDVEGAQRRFREARRSFGRQESEAIETLRQTWSTQPETFARIDRAAQDESYTTLLAVLQEEIRKIDAAHRDLETAVAERRFELRLSARLLSGDQSTAVHLPGYDDLETGAVMRRDRMGLDLSNDEKQRLMEQWRSTVELARTAEQVREGKLELQDAMQALAAELAPEIGRAMAAAAQLEQALAAIPIQTLIPDTRQDLEALAVKARAAAERLGQDLAQRTETRLRALARSLESAARIHAAITQARELARAWQAARPETLVELLTRSAQLGRELPQLLADLEQTFREQGGATLAELLGGLGDQMLTAVQGLLTEPEAQRLAQRLAQVRQVWLLGRQLHQAIQAVVEDLQGQPVPGEIEPPKAIRVPVEEVRDTALDLSRTPRREGDTVQLRAELFRQAESRPFAQLEASFVPRYFGWNATLSPAVVLVRPDRMRGQDEKFAFAPALSWLHRYTPRPEDQGLLDGVARTFRPGLGIHATFLNFDTQKEVEIGLGATLAVWDQRLQFGAGVNLMAEDEHLGRYYFFVGSDLISLLNSVGIGKGP